MNRAATAQRFFRIRDKAEVAAAWALLPLATHCFCSDAGRFNGYASLHYRLRSATLT
jgi:hypothetical protein